MRSSIPPLHHCRQEQFEENTSGSRSIARYSSVPCFFTRELCDEALPFLCVVVEKKKMKKQKKRETVTARRSMVAGGQKSRNSVCYNFPPFPPVPFPC